ncbi:MAG: TolC family protein [Runella slithyformis]|nr:MAG: TolC family protein [Runella slithyformis]TAF29607.1 MAG: TolC family protein [Runella slithyformis]TAF48442.1 MAG: TolC family protein [Runella slithyformis]TAF83000.1 MAG: TolC family protein [Runella slithyformis]TAH15069.1 MAG: TolC family protein [Runella slithyformis]
MRPIIACILAICLPFFTIAQEKLSLDNAIAIALEKSFGVKIAKSREEINRNDNTRGNAGMLPVVTGAAQQNFTNNNVNQTFFSIGATTREPLVQSGINNRNNNASLTAVWTVFDGLGMYATAQRLREIESLGKTNVEINIENTVAEVCNAYYDIIRQKQRLKALKNALDISGVRRELAKANYKAGATSKVEYLAAQVDFNSDQAALVAQQQNLQNAKVNLNALLVRDFNLDFAVPDTILVRQDLAIDKLRNNLNSQNPNLIAARQSQNIASIAEKETRAARYPRVDLLAGYNYFTANNEAGFGAKSTKTGQLSYGARLAVPIYDGYNQRRREQNAKVNTRIAEYQEADLRNQLQSILERTFNAYQNSLELLKLEEQNLKIARQNVEIAFDRYKVGNSTPIEFREAQRNAVAAESRTIEAAFNIKLAEIELLRLSSSIVEEAK